ncbi:MAG TPA: hypothetical protein VF407_00965 [Polyangiaceae bacterium]
MAAKGLALAFTGLLVAGGGCSKCGSSHPYVPYSIGEGGVGTEGDDGGAADVPAGDAGAFFASVPAVLAPPNISDWTVDGAHLVAPVDHLFGSAIVRDFDGDGTRDVFAVVAKPSANEEVSVAWYKGLAGAPDGRFAPPVIVARPPQDDGPCPTPPNGVDAKTAARLVQVGPHAVGVEIPFACIRGSRLLRLVSAEKGNVRDRFDLEIDDPQGAAPLSFALDATDRDGDGIDDVALQVTMDPGGAPFEPGPKLTATLKWFDRPAGLSRDPEEPDASLRRIATPLLARAKGKEAAQVPIVAHQLRALYGAMCQEGGKPRITNAGWARGISCGMSHALEDAGIAESRAYATTGDVLRAIVAKDRAELAPATRTPARITEADAAIAAAAPSVNQAQLRAVGAVPQIHRAKGPGWGALAFDDAGKLLVRTLAGVVRVDPVQGDEAAATDVSTWPLDVISPDGQLRFVEAYSPCDTVALHATFAPVAAAKPDADMIDLSLPVEPPLGSTCASAKGNPAAAIPIAWTANGLEAFVAREPIAFSPDLKRASAVAQYVAQPTPHGSPKSPDGKSIALAVTNGILVRSDKTRLFKAPELEGGYGELRDCTTSNDGLRVACVRGGKAFVGVWTLP